MKIVAIIVAATLGTCFFGSDASTAEIKRIAGPPFLTFDPEKAWHEPAPSERALNQQQSTCLQRHRL